MRIFNTIKDLFDKRDHVAAPAANVLSSTVDLRQWAPPIINQGDIGCCTGCTGTRILSWNYKKFHNLDLVFSSLFLYRAERLCEGDPQVDGGAQSRTMMACMQEVGVCLESSFPITEGWQKPTSPELLKEASQYKIGAYHRIPNLDTLKSVLASGYPASIAIDVFESFEGNEAAKTGNIPMPAKGEKSIGGHEITVMGYSDKSKVLIIENSWGTSFGDSGTIYLPYDYVPLYAMDMWTCHFGKW